jgi:5-methylcytosine-specific restriction endonuclease McrA
MARLINLKPRLQTLGSRVAVQSRQDAEAERFKERDRNVGWRKRYSTARWQRLRQEVWIRDNYTCQKTGILCIGKYPADNSPVADHIVAHRGDEDLFWDPSNLQTVSKAYHDSQKQKHERSRPDW